MDARAFIDDVAQEDSDEELDHRDAEAVRYDAKDRERQHKFDVNAFQERIEQQQAFNEENDQEYSDENIDDIPFEPAVVE